MACILQATYSVRLVVGMAIGLAMAGTLLLATDVFSGRNFDTHNATHIALHNVSELQPQQSLRVRNSSVALLSIGVLHKDAAPHMRYIYWAATASKHAYAAEWGLPFYVMTQGVTTRYAAWDKLVAIKAVMAHSGADWVWCTDSDAMVMNTTVDIEAFVRGVLMSQPNASVIVAKDCNGINTGSWLLRNTPWTNQHVTEAWFLNDTSVVSISICNLIYLLHVLHTCVTACLSFRVLLIFHLCADVCS
jgi:hypothetical protein